MSLRTFFNYFPSKDIAIVGEGPPLIDEERALPILDEAGDELLKGIARISRPASPRRVPARSSNAAGAA